jgi:hypothetical protein
VPQLTSALANRLPPTVVVDPCTSALAAASPPTSASLYTTASISGFPAAGAAGSRLRTPTDGGRFKAGRGTVAGAPLLHGARLAMGASYGGRRSPTC